MVKEVKKILSVLLATAMVFTGNLQTVFAAQEVEDVIITSDDLATDNAEAEEVFSEESITIDDENVEFLVDWPDLCGKNTTWSFNKTTGILTISGKGDMVEFNDVGPWAISRMEKDKMNAFLDFLRKYYREEGMDASQIPSDYTAYKKVDYTNDIKEVVIEEGVTSASGFANLPNLTKVTIPASVSEISSNAFMNCPKLKDINFTSRNGNTLSINSNAFTNCAFSEFVFPDGVYYIFSESISNCQNLTTVEVPSSVVYIEGFDASNENLKTIKGTRGTVAESFVEEHNKLCDEESKYTFVEEGSANRFEYDSTTKTLIIKYTGNSVMTGFKKIYEDFSMADDAARYEAYRNEIKGIIPWAEYYDKATSIVVENGFTNIGANAFMDFYLVESISLPASVTRIDAYAFSGCTGLKTVNVAGKLRAIGSNAFEHCSSLEDISFIDGVSAIPFSCFNWCSALENIVIPDSVEIVESNAFSDCDGLKSVTIGYTDEASDEEPSYISLGALAFSNNSSLESFKVKEKYKTINAMASQIFDSDIQSFITVIGIFENSPKMKTVGPLGSNSNIEMGANGGLYYFIHKAGWQDLIASRRY